MRIKFILPLLLALLLTSSGCYLLETKTNSAGKEVTNLEAVLTKAQTGINTVSPVVNAFVPGAGTIAGGVGLLLALVGGLTTSIVIAKRRGGALAAVIKGVELASNADTKAEIKEIAGSLGVEPYLNKIIKKYYPT